MIRTLTAAQFRKELAESRSPDAALSGDVAEIIRRVRRDGDKALAFYANKFDGVKIRSPKVTPKKAKIERALENDIRFAFERVLRYHREYADDSQITEDGEGGIWGRIVRPMKRIAVYVPGGSAVLFSTMLMGVAAARAAGVKEVVVVTPPPPNDFIRVTAKICGVTELYQAGGAQAIAALAYGTESIRPVEKIVGPGNRYVTEAKRQVYGTVGIESLAGPSEILILSDGSTPPEIIAADMIAQAEHDVWARAAVIVLKKSDADQIREALTEQLKTLPRRSIAEKSLRERGAIVVARNLSEMVALSNETAPEHLEILVDNPWDLIDKVTAAGAIFVGPNAPEVLGDYLAGPNHILPTGGTARFSAPLSARDFVSVSSVQWFGPDAAATLAGPAARMARAEGLEGHARAAEMRRR